MTAHIVDMHTMRCERCGEPFEDVWDFYAQPCDGAHNVLDMAQWRERIETKRTRRARFYLGVKPAAG